MNVQFDQDTIALRDDLTVTIGSLDIVLVESDISMVSQEVDLSQGQTIPLGAVNSPGLYTIHIANGDDHFISCVTSIPVDESSFTVTHDDISLSPPQVAPQPFSSDVLGKFIQNLSADRITNAVNKATQNFPEQYAVAIGATVAICTVSLALLQPEFCYASVAGTVIDFASKINDILIDDMETDGTLLDGEAQFLKLLWGAQALLSDAVNFENSPGHVETIINSLEAATDTIDLVTTDGNVHFGVRSASALATKSLIFYKFK